MSNLNVTLVQSSQFWEDKGQNLAHFDVVLQAIENTDLVVLPEMFHTGFSMRAAELAEKMETSQALHWMKNTAMQKNIAIYTSFIAEENGQFFNRGIFMFPTGEYTIYDKRQLFSLAGEDQFYSAGKKAQIVEYKGWKIQLQICYDLRFPEIVRNEIAPNGEPAYDVILYVANWPERRAHHWKTLLLARAIENQCYVVGVNRVGVDGKALNYSGNSTVVDALGNSIVTFEDGEASHKTAELNKDELNKTRAQLAFLKDRSC